jgi:hypothetical protein
MKKIDIICFGKSPQLLAPTVDSDQAVRGGHLPWCWDEDEALLSRLGCTTPQAKLSAIAAGHHGVPKLFKKSDTEGDVVWSEVGEGSSPILQTDK